MDEDYITLLPTANPRKFLVVVMHYRKRDDEYVQGRVSQPLNETAAKSLAEMWAAAMKLSVR